MTGTASPGSRSARKVDISYDPYNLNAVWVRHPETDEWIECWDTALDDRSAWMAAEAAVKLVERFGTGDGGETPKTAEFLDDVERRARSDKRARSRQLRDQRIPAESERTDERVAEPTPIMLRDWATPVDVDDIDWNSSDYDIVTIKDIRS